MTRRCADSVTPANLPPGFDLYGGYDDGNYNNVNAIKAMYPNKTVIHFTVFASDNFGDILDVENGDATPAQAPGWVKMRRAAGHGGPLVYCSEATWSQVRQAFQSAGVPEPGYWIAGYPGSVGHALYPGSIAHQWIDYGPYDESIVVDYLPGIDPVPSGGGDVPLPTDVVDSWSVPGTDGGSHFDLHADGGLFAYGCDPNQLEYVACGNDGSRYHFGPKQTPGVISYPGLPPQAGVRHFVKMTVLTYNGQPANIGPAGPPGQPGTPGTSSVNIAQIHAAGAALSGA